MRKIFSTFLLCSVLALGMVTYGSNAKAEESPVNSVLAIKSAPERSHPNVSFEFDGYRVPSIYGDDGKDYVFTGGAGFTVAGQSLGLGYAYDEATGDTDFALATTVGLKNLKIRIGYSQDPDNFFSDLGTVGVGVRFGF